MDDYAAPGRHQLPLALCDEEQMAVRLTTVHAEAAEFAAVAAAVTAALEAATDAAHRAFVSVAEGIAMPADRHEKARRGYRDPCRPTSFAVSVTANAHEPGAVQTAELTVSGESHIHYLGVATRRANQRALDAELALSRFESRELRRRRAVMRAAAARVEQQGAMAERGAAMAAQAAARGEASVERNRRRQSGEAAVRAKHSRLDAGRGLSGLRAAARSVAVRRTDMAAAEVVAAQAAAAERREKDAAAKAYAVVRASRTHSRAVEDEAQLLGSRRAKMVRDFAAMARAGEADCHQVVARRAAADLAAAERRQSHPMAVNVSLPADLVAPPPSDDTPRKSQAIGMDRYARLCGVRHMPSAASSIGTIANVVEARHIPPSAWGLLHQLDPRAAEMTYAAAASAAVRGPTMVRWK